MGITALAAARSLSASVGLTPLDWMKLNKGTEAKAKLDYNVPFADYG
jgi:hypothetical protein